MVSLNSGTNTNLSHPPDIFNNPWSYRIADFPENYKLFVKERKVDGNNYPQKDHYLHGGSPPSPSMYNIAHNLLQVESMSIGHPRNFIHTYTGYLRMLRGSAIHASANTVILAEHRSKSTKNFHSPHARRTPKGLGGPRNTGKQ